VLLYAARTGSAWTSRRPAPAAGSLAEKAGLRSGDWVRASVPADTLASGGSEIRSMTDLRWQVMQAAIDRDPLVLEVSDASGRGLRRVTLDLDRVDGGDVDSSFLTRVVGLPPPFAPPVMGDPVAGGPAARAGLRSGDRVLRVDGEPVLDAHQLRLRIRKLGPDSEARPMTWLVERQGRTLELVVMPRVLGDGAQRIGRIDAIVGKVLPEMVTVRLGLLDGLTRGATLTWEQATLTLKMIGRMLVGEASLKNLSGPITIADYAGQSAERRAWPTTWASWPW
jgi:regulator of sigma E protease